MHRELFKTSIPLNAYYPFDDVIDRQKFTFASMGIQFSSLGSEGRDIEKEHILVNAPAYLSPSKIVQTMRGAKLFSVTERVPGAEKKILENALMGG